MFGFGKLIGKRFSKTHSKTAKPARRRYSTGLQIEHLEDRQLMSITDMTQLAQMFPAHPGPTMLYLNFDGGTVNTNGVSKSISAFTPLAGDTRNADIAAIMKGVAHDFAPFNVEVEQIYGAGSYDSSNNGNTTIFIGGDSANVAGNLKYSYSYTPFAFVDAPGFVKGLNHTPHSDPFNLAFVDPVTGQANSATWATTNSIAQTVSSIAHEVGHTFGLEHVLSNPQQDIMSYDAANTSFIDQTFNVTDLNNNGTTTTNGGNNFYAWWQEGTFVYDKITTQDSYTYLMAVLGPSQNQLAVAKDVNGYMESFAIGPNHDLIYQVQVNAWGNWRSLGGYVESFTVSHNADDRLEVFAIGADNAVWHKWQDSSGNWSNWYSLGGYVRQVTVGINGDGRMEIFAIGYDYSLWHIWQVAPNSGWSGRDGLAGYLKQITVGTNADGRLEVFGIGGDNSLWHIWQVAPSSSWSDWASLGGYVKQISVARNADGRLEVFAIGDDNALWHMSQFLPNGYPISIYDNGWSLWDSLGGYVKQITVGSNTDGRLEVFAIGGDNALYHKWENYQSSSDNWSGWGSLGGWIGQLAVGANYYGRLEVLGIGSDNQVWHNSQTQANAFWAWTDWYGSNQKTL